MTAMKEKTILGQYYTIEIVSFKDGMKRKRQKLDMMVSFVYTSSTTVRDERCLYLTWYSNPDPQLYNSWDFIQLTIGVMHLEILTATALITEIAMMHGMQPREFESRLQTLGFRRK